jgi:phage regulator Rha-like protein
MPDDNELTLNNGNKIKISGQSVAEYVAWRDAMLRRTGQELASKMPKFFGKVEFNIQNGHFVNWNLKLSGK